MGFRGHVCLEPVSLEAMQLALVYLKQNNLFYHDTGIGINNISDKLLNLTEDTD